MVRGRNNSSFKFIQKLWNLNLKFLDEINKNHIENEDNEVEKYTNQFLKNLTLNLDNFNYNKIIANIHEIHSVMSKLLKKYKKQLLKIIIKKF